jgi:hypothetical protein
MTEATVRVTLRASDGAESSQPGQLSRFTPVDRLRRAGLVMLGALLLAATLIPIPIIHLLGIPLMLIGGVVIAVKQSRAVARLKPMGVPCPRCAGINRIGGGIGFRSIDTPIERMCENCRRILHLTIEAA